VNRALRAAVVALIAMWSVLALLPVYASIIASVKDPVSIVADPIGIPSIIRMDNYARAWQGSQLGRPLAGFMINSVVAVVVGVGLGMSLAVPTAYLLARRPSRLGIAIQRYMVLLIVVPSVLAWIPLFTLAASLGVLSQPVALGVVYAAFTVPVAVVLMRSYFVSFPWPLVDASRVDGATEAVAFLRIVLPMSWPSIGIVSLVQGIFAWNELALAIILLPRAASQTLQVGLVQFTGQFSVDLGAQFAGLTIGAIPILAAAVLFNRQLATGLRLRAFDW